jgi:(1->4)-alpha-D-glucan 1-alpha-D-glucosylmutase
VSAIGGDLRELAQDLVAAKADGRIKLYVTWRSLRCRRESPGLFSAGEYIPLAASGSQAAHLFAFARRAGEACAIVAVPRLPARLAPNPGQPPLGEPAWQETRLLLPEVDPSRRWCNVFAGQRLAPTEGAGRLALPAAEVFAHFPVALLVAG